MMRDAIRQAPHEAIYIAWSAWALFWSHPEHNQEMALTQLELAAQADRDLPEAFLFKARILEHQGEYDEAQRYYFTAARKPGAPTRLLDEAKAFEAKLLEARRNARKTNTTLSDMMEIEDSDFFKRWVIDDG